MTAHDYVIVGGGTAGCVLAARLTEDPDVTVAVIEGGPSDVGDEKILDLRNWINLLGTEYDYDYPTVEQPRGNSHIRHSRAKVLGGCSSHNTLICFTPLPQDFDEWGHGWTWDAIGPYYAKVQLNIIPVAEKDRNPIAEDFVAAARQATGVPEIDDFNAKPFEDGVGFFSVAYHPEENNRRSSASTAYLHEILDSRGNLTLLPNTWAGKIEFDGTRAIGVHTDRGYVEANREVLLCAGAIDTPRLLMLSGVGDAEHLSAIGIEPKHDLPGVGENLLDHPESVIVWETTKPLPENSVMDSDAGLFLRRDPSDPRPDLMFHFYQIPFTTNTERLGYPKVEHGVCMTPNVPRPHSKGKLWLKSSGPAEKPALDFGYFTHPDGYDEQTLVDGFKIAREIAAREPLKSWLAREIAPGPDVTSDEELSEYGRRAAHTVYHPAGTCAIGSVVDGDLKVIGLEGLRVVDASVFPTMPTVNPMVTVLMIGERAADLIRGARGA
ncbi:GMC oxidoreductase [Lentzea sp. DG1S-22]|uniref:GMC family oxidoreductase n=1 Tax=Lentzea sp. DG1S-22 TaxID=3108822 RepID=UPI002E78F493|nr:GMC oxidoreductase [Lentzea sp. DG1S-22]WVH84429.1 GMC oxidoreductase [Lentzea sp. DG1S-22]